MPIEFAPPQSNVNYQITPPQYSDPLQTLAQMGQLRTQGLQQQEAQMQLEQARRKMDSQKGVIRWLADMNKPEATQETQPAAPAAPSPAPSADTGTGGFTPISGYTPVTPPTPAPVAAAPAAQPQPQPSSDSGFLGRMARDASKYGILPDDWFAIQNHYLDYKTKSATLSEAQKKIDSDNADAMAGAYRQLAQNKTADQGDLNAVNNGLIARGVPREWLMTSLPAGHGDVTPQMMIQAHGNTQLKLGQMLENEQKQSAAAASQATVTKEGVLTDEAKSKLAVAHAAQAASELQTAPVDANGAIMPAADADIRRRYSDVKLPPGPLTKEAVASFLRSRVDPKDQPEYDIKLGQANAMRAWQSGDPTKIDQVVDNIAPQSDPMNATTKNLLHYIVNSGGTKQDFDKAVKDLYDHRKTIATETDPTVQAAKIQVARAEAQNRQNITIAGYGQQLGATLGGGGTGGAGGPAAPTGEAYLATLNPALAARIRNTARGDLDPPTGRAATSGPGGAFMNALLQYDPNFTTLLGQKRKTELQDFSKTSPGSAGGNVVALNTMIHHGDLYQETADALQNGTFKPGNAVWNRVKDAFGKAPPTQANLVAQFLAGETAKVAGENTGGAVNDILKNLQNANSPDQIRGAGRTLIGIAAGRMVPYKERIADAKLENLAPPLLGPSAREILIRRGFDPETMKPVQQGGGAGHSIQIGNKFYRYNGSGDTRDLKNYTEVK